MPGPRWEALIKYVSDEGQEWPSIHILNFKSFAELGVKVDDHRNAGHRIIEILVTPIGGAEN